MASNNQLKSEQLRLQAKELILKADKIDGETSFPNNQLLTRKNVDDWLKEQAEDALTKHYHLDDQQKEALSKLWPVINALDIKIETMMPLMDLIWLSWLHQKYNGNPNQFMISAGAEMAARIDTLTRDINESMNFGGAQYNFIESMKLTLGRFV
jgi:hypothetical protein